MTYKISIGYSRAKKHVGSKLVRTELRRKG